MRGKVESELELRKTAGITPAYAGKRNNKHKQHDNHGDHPRLCGEKYEFENSFPAGTGSPPPMRGKVRNNAD